MTPRSHVYFHVILSMVIANTTCFADFIPQKIATGAYHTCVLSTDGSVKCWGYNISGQLGTGDTQSRGNLPDTMGHNLRPIDLGLNEGDKTVDICAGYIYSCALTLEGGVKCWGENGSGQLGQGILSNKNFTMGKALPYSDLGKNFKAKELVCGNYHACALSDQGLVKCWGTNVNGALGLGDKIARGRRPEDMGDNLPALAGLTNIKALSTGSNHSCALSADGLRCWGDGNEGQLGLELGEVRGGTPETIPNKSPFINVTANSNEIIERVTAGFNTSCALIKTKVSAEKNSVFAKCWGSNRSGALGTGNTIQYGMKPETMGAALPRLDLALDEIASINPHLGFTCALSKTGIVKCWGTNKVGELGQGDSRMRGVAASDMGKALPDVDLGLPVKSLSAGPASFHSCAILVNNHIKCWGRGGEGQLGYENTVNTGLMAGQMGDALSFVRFK